VENRSEAPRPARRLPSAGVSVDEGALLGGGDARRPPRSGLDSEAGGRGAGCGGAGPGERGGGPARGCTVDHVVVATDLESGVRRPRPRPGV